MDRKARRVWLQKELRRSSIKWFERNKALRAARVEKIVGKFKNGSPKKKVLFTCAKCREAFDRKDVHVDHIDPVGSFQNWDDYIERLFCPASNLQILCAPCHKRKTKEER